jgi:hypothetical protein
LGTDHNDPHWSFRFGAVVSGAKPQAIAPLFSIGILSVEKTSLCLNHFGAQKSYIKSRKKV